MPRKRDGHLNPFYCGAIKRKDRIDMTDFNELANELSGLAIFRSLLDDPVIAPLTKLIRAVAGGTPTLGLYAEFIAALYAHGDNLTEYVMNATLENENVYLLRRAQQKEVPSVIADCLAHELTVLETISQLTPKMLRREMDYDGFLPKWSTGPCEFARIYEERAAQISTHGYGMFAKYDTFMLHGSTLVPVKSPDRTELSALFGYEMQRHEVLENTAALLNGKPAVNILLYGDAGTGKSSTVKAVANYYKKQGLRLVELKKRQLHQIPELIDHLSSNPLKFILFIDDLSFTRDDDDFSALKAVLEGSVSSKSDNVVIYATSNRRHLVRENFSDRNGDDIHFNDTMQEMVSLSDRFGLTITFLRPNKMEYQSIISELARQYKLDMDANELAVKADAFAIRKSGYSPRVAKQFIELMKAAAD